MMKTGWLAWVLLAAALVGCAPKEQEAARGEEPAPKALREVKPGGAPIDVVLTPATRPALAALAAPLVSRLGRQGRRPKLLCLSSPPGEEALVPLRRMRPGRALVLLQGEAPELARGLQGVPAEALRLGAAGEASIALARRFWGTSEQAVLACVAEPAELIVASALAAHAGVPLLLTQAWSAPPKGLGEALGKMAVKELLVVTATSPRAPDWASGAWRVTVLRRSQAEGRLIGRIGAAQVRTIVVAREPGEGKLGQLAWLAPYWSLIRSGAVALVDNDAATGVEHRVRALIEAHKLSPRSVTLLAGYASIGSHDHAVALKSGVVEAGYRFPVEPCELPTGREALALAVGRIPAANLESASALMLRGLLREGTVGKKPANVLLVANPTLEGGGGLMLCETVSRVTGEELRNLGVTVAEFYRVRSNSPAILTAARQANLILYQGHSSEQQIFEDADFLLRSEGAQEGFGEPIQVEGDDFARRLISRRGPIRTLSGFPFVVLQSCSSLQERFVQQVFRESGVGLVGSVTAIHSASGSTFLKALIDGMLYRGDTIGEALRDARNYFLCLQDLKNARGHKEQAKSMRVALSFRLWGDPELRLLVGKSRQPTRAPVTAAWSGAHQLVISLPRERLPESKTAGYVAQTFPASQLAGLVGKTGGGPRRLKPLYFFRMSRPDGFGGRVRAPRKGKARTAHRTDSLGRHVYVVHFPGKERPGGSTTLRFRTR